MAVYRHRVSGPGAAGDFWTTTMHSSGTDVLADAHAAWNAAVNGFLTTLLPLWPNDQAVSGTQTDKIDVATGKNLEQVTTASTQPGTDQTAGTVSQRSSVVISFKTSLPTRAGRGRMYWPPVASVSLDSKGQLLGSVASSLSSQWASRLTTMKLVTTPVIYHRPVYDPGPPRVLVKPGTITPILTVRVGIIIGTQRRRTNRVNNSYTTTPI